jgi:hypothetical protein
MRVKYFSRIQPTLSIKGAAVFIAGLLIVGARAQTPLEPGASLGVELKDISQNGPQFASAFPFVAISPKYDGTVLIGWRLYSLPIDTNAPKGSRTAECHVAISKDGGATFKDTNLMDVLQCTVGGGRARRHDVRRRRSLHCQRVGRTRAEAGPPNGDRFPR